MRNRGKTLEEVVAEYAAHNDRREHQQVAEGMIPRRPSLPPLSSNSTAQIKSIISSAERRLSKMSPDAREEVEFILNELKAVLP